MLLRLLAVLVGLTLVAATWGQNLDSAQDNMRLRVNALNLTGMGQERLHGLDEAEINDRLLVERSRFAETMTVDELHQLADALTVFLRDSGYVFHTVYLPPQRAEGGVVELRMREGVFVGVNIINGTRWPDKRLQRLFDKLIGRLLYAPEVEEGVQALKAQGGFRVFAYYSRGQKSGEAILNLRVDPTDKRAFSLKADNHGSPASGENRVILQYSEYQLTGHHDTVSVALLHAVDGVANAYGSIAYQLPFGGLDYAWDISASNNQFEVGDRFASLGLEGDASTVRTGLTAITRQNTNSRAFWRLGIYEKRNTIEFDDTIVVDELSQVASLQWSKSLRSADSGAVLQSLLEYSYGQYGIYGLPDGDFNKLHFSVLLAKGFGKGRWRNLLQLSTRGQYSDVMLPNIESLGLVGAYGVRGYTPDPYTADPHTADPYIADPHTADLHIPELFNADSAVLAAVEWRLPNLFSKGSLRLEPYLFAEYARGRKDDIQGNRQEAQFTGTGVGLTLGWGQSVMIQVAAAQAANGTIDGVKVEGDDKVLFEIRLQ